MDGDINGVVFRSENSVVFGSENSVVAYNRIVFGEQCREGPIAGNNHISRIVVDAVAPLVKTESRHACGAQRCRVACPIGATSFHQPLVVVGG